MPTRSSREFHPGLLSDRAQAVIDGTSGLTLNITGNGQTTTAVSGGGLYDDFCIGYVGSGSSSGSVDISGLTIENAGTGGGTAGCGGTGSGIYNFGDNSTSLTVTNSTISGNTANAEGGGIFTLSPTTLNDDTISGNTAPGGGGGILEQNAPVTITDSTILGNSGIERGRHLQLRRHAHRNR